MTGSPVIIIPTQHEIYQLRSWLQLNFQEEKKNTYGAERKKKKRKINQFVNSTKTQN